MNKLAHQAVPISAVTDPEKTIWVSANAGSGKTFVLSRRVIRLMLEGAKPSELLCLTFTKAAAAEMENRVFEILGDWVLKPESDLSAELEELTGRRPCDALLGRARRLFAIALDTPGGLRIQTLHAFCESLLHQFTLEANVPGHFQLMDDIEQPELIAEARQFVLTDPKGADADILELLDSIRDTASDDAFEQAVSELIGKRERLAHFIGRHGGDARLAADSIFQTFDLDPETTDIELFERFRTESGYLEADLETLKTALGELDGTRASEILEALAALDLARDPIEHHYIRRRIFLTDNVEPRKSLVSSKFTSQPGIEEPFRHEQALLLDQIDQLKTLKAAKLTSALLIIVDRILTEYERLKLHRGQLDFDDLIEKTARLLARSEMASWVQYKLDSRISHVLIDEAQDTSPLQWRIIEAITSEFYAGQSARDQLRTIFVVGDEKQSIFSFQGADPEEFTRQYKKLMRRTKQADMRQETITLRLSWRSTQEVLSAVDQVFSLAENSQGLNRTVEAISHTAKRQGRGEVIVWPLIRQPDKPEKSDWLAPPDRMPENSAEEQLAKKIAAEISEWINGGEILPGRKRPIRYGDILILVRKRDRFVPAITRELRRLGLRSAGADRLKLVEHIAIEDMIALGRFAGTEIDDLALAGLLKSPLFDFDEDDLFAIAHGRKGSLLQSLLSHAMADAKDSAVPRAKLEAANTVINFIRHHSGNLPVFEFFSRLFAKFRLRERYVARLGHEVEEVLDGFFQAAVEFDVHGGLGMGDFVEWLALANPEMKRSVDMKTDEIRIITAHSSKGLEAPIVFLVDPSSKPYETRHAPRIVSAAKDEEDWLPVWQWAKDSRIKACEPAFAKIERQAEEEYRRLLYVGMTRAADRLIICGYQGKRDINHDHWHRMILAGLRSETDERQTHGGHLTEEIGADGEIEAWRWNIDRNEDTAGTMEEDRSETGGQGPAIPEWLQRPATHELAIPAPLSPSAVPGSLDIDESESMPAWSDDGFALLRGSAIHALLELLHDVPSSEYARITNHYLANLEPGLPPVLQQEIAESVSRVLDMMDRSTGKDAKVRVEVDIIGELRIGSRARLVRGKIDRLAFLQNAIVISDYKTNRTVPETPDRVSRTYLAQMALYRELVRQAFQTEEVECELVWTETVQRMPLPTSLLDSEFDRLTNL